MSRLAIVLFNLGGPDGPGAVKPFLFNLFNDPAITSVAAPIRWILAQFLSSRRAPVARSIYEKMGGGSPLLELTRDQATALETCLGDAGETRVFVAMRYWHPLSEETAAAVKAFDPDRIVLLPLYPQFSTTTTGSSFDEWKRASAAVGLAVPTRSVCCYPSLAGLVDIQARLVRAGIDEASRAGKPRVLFSAHGLPKRIVARGDPYPWQVERTVRAVVKAVAVRGLDWVVCYQSRVGPLEWIGPATDEELVRAAAEGVPVVVVPVAFVSEHSETLVELDVEYRKIAEERGIPAYVRVPAVATGEDFIKGLADLVRVAREDTENLRSADGARICPASFVQCPHGGAPAACATPRFME